MTGGTALPHGQDLAHGNQHQSSPSVLKPMETISFELIIDLDFSVSDMFPKNMFGF